MLIFKHISDPGDVAMLFNEDSMDDECFLNVLSEMRMTCPVTL